MAKKISILDIAKALGVSPTTVSFVLNGRAKEKRISERLEEQVLKYVNEIGYKPNSLARSLRTGKTNTIGLVVESISNTFFSNIARAIEDIAYANGYRILYSSTENSIERTRAILQMFADRQVDGYIISPPEGVEAEIQRLVEGKKPVVLFDRMIDKLGLDSVSINNEFSAYNATKVFLGNGYKLIACVTLDSRQQQMKDREEGYVKALEDSALSPIVYKADFDISDDDFKNGFSSFLTQHAGIDAILFTTNYLAIKGLRHLRNMGYKVGETFGLIAFDEHDLFELHQPPITVIAQPIEEIAQKLIALLLDRLGTDRILEPQHLVLPTTLQLRASSNKNLFR
ncbi:LacI family DNA-binding transcriptional regulator [Olivibacter sitiensis]|uniref:LacI family DNA-binding transcriptional regulator n=1 Tax=Olivibacter sitiensis TaxID=376470 RepID=UPI00042719D9|nr:substrate-binding domain-containing protein [Olivibacter sitiensis]